MKTKLTQKNIPDGWLSGNLQDFVVSVIDGDRGKNYPSHADLVTDGFCLFLTATNVSKNGFNFAENQFISKEKDSKMSKGKLIRGDIIITTRGTIGNIAFYSEKIPFNHIRINSGMAIIRNNNKIIKTEFLFGYFNSARFSKEIKRVSFGSAQPQLTIQIIKKFELLAPKQKDEQNRIVSVLETWDRAVEVLGRKIEIKKRIKRWLMVILLTGAVRLPGFTEKWETKKLGNLCDIGTGKKNNQDKLDNGIYPFFVRSPFVERINSYSYDGEAILVPGEGNIGKIFHYINGKFDFHQRVYKISDFSKGVSGKYIYFYLVKSFSKATKSDSVKATVDSLRLPTFTNFQVKLPSLLEQEYIVNILTTADNEITALEKKLALLKDQKKYLLNNLITGTIRTPQNI